ncbi:WD repeat-containing protein 24-like protein [Leptotrombidium deliense]|uniref:GATOR2 complex protein WDR24 n=1 Tax=Leptotrombidium deliense TaxID=299467 RepID=A0A443SU40_9ACAR|nr:WD repeat-containing protein 24-like protein [Leptotrombidium deliense]
MKNKTFYVSCDGAANALAANKEANQVAVAGRNVFKIFDILDEKNIFMELVNLRVGKNLNLNYSCLDVVWSPADDNLLATGATNGAVVIWNIQKSTRSKIGITLYYKLSFNYLRSFHISDQVYSHHKRTVHKVCFHPCEAHLLLSGSQDGTMKLFDLRKHEVSTEFNSLSESVRDVQFSPHSEVQFAAVQENGNVQLWDMRKPDKYLRQFTAHSGPVFSCDWHPEDRRFFATGGRDKTIKIWDLSLTPTGNPAVEHCIQSIYSVAKVKWRPQRRTNIASCSLLLDSTIYVWDVMRTFVPFATFTEHTDVTTDFVWRNSPNTILSTGKDGVLYQHSMTDAHRPADQANPCGLAINNYGDVCHAVSELISKSNAGNSTGPYVSVPNNKSNFLSATSAAIVHFASGSLRVLKKKTDYHEQFKCCSSSLLYSKNQNSNRALAMDWFVISALRYKLSGRPINELCLQNADVATHLNRPQVAQTWRVINQMFTGGRTGTFSAPSSASVAVNSANVADDKMFDTSDIRAPSRHTSGSMSGKQLNGNRGSISTQSIHPAVGTLNVLAATDHTSAQTDEDTDSSEDVESIFRPTNKTYVRHNEKVQQSDYFFGDGDVSSSATLAVSYVPNGVSLVDENQDWDLPKEAFQPRHPIQDLQIPPDIDAINTYPSSPTSLDEDEMATEEVGSVGAGMQNSIDMISKSLLSTTCSPNPSWKFMDIIVDILHFYAAQGDIQTTISIIIVLGERIKSSVDETLLEFWFHSYIDLLSRYELWNVVSQIICLSPVRNINLLNQTSTTVYSNCGNCLKPLSGKVAWICEKCKVSPTIRGICKGVYVWCQGCSHGGHVLHMKEWFAKNRFCPTGCGHQCEYN